MVLVVVAFETEFFVANTFDILLRYKISFSAQVFTSNLRTPSRVLIVIGVISVVPEHVLIVILKLARITLPRREKLKKHGVRDHHVTVLLLACCVNTLTASFNFLF